MFHHQLANIGSTSSLQKETILVRHRKVPTGRLNKVISEMVEKHPVMIQRSKSTLFKVKYASMVKTSPSGLIRPFIGYNGMIFC